MPVTHPLTADHCQCLDHVLKSVPVGMDLVQACEDCGLDVSEHKATLQQQQQLAQKLKAKFFPYQS